MQNFLNLSRDDRGLQNRVDQETRQILKVPSSKSSKSSKFAVFTAVQEHYTCFISVQLTKQTSQIRPPHCGVRRTLTFSPSSLRPIPGLDLSVLFRPDSSSLIYRAGSLSIAIIFMIRTKYACIEMKDWDLIILG